MRSKKMFGLVVATALAALAFSAAVGAGSASATELYKEKEKFECPVGRRFPSNITLKGESTNFTLTWPYESGPGPITCNSETEVETESSHSNGALAGQMTKLSLSGCNYSICYVGSQAVKNLPYATSIEAAGSGNGSLELRSSGKGDPLIELSGCVGPEFKYNCGYGLPWFGGMTIEGDASPHLHMTENKLSQKSGPTQCPPSVTITADFELTRSRLRFSGYTSASKIEAGSFEVSCASSLGGYDMEQSPGTIDAFSLTGCSGTCPTATTLGLPYATSFAAAGEGGTLTISEGPKTELAGCFGFTKCSYAGSSPTLEYGSGLLVASKEKLVRTSGSLCPSTASWSASYAMSVEEEGEELWVN